MTDEEKALRRTLRQQAIDAWGTAHILGIRFRRWSRLRRLNTLAGVLVPVVIGSLYIAFPQLVEETAWPISLASLLLAVHAIGSATVAVWGNEDKSYVLHESVARNRNIAIRSNRLARKFPLEPAVFKALSDELISEYKALEEHDENRLGASQRERRVGFRAGLFRFDQKCGLCERIPSSERLFLYLRSRNCNRCGEPLNDNTKSTRHPQGHRRTEPGREEEAIEDLS